MTYTMTDTMASWVYRPVQLKFTAGEFVFYRARFDAAVMNVHFTRLTDQIPGNTLLPDLAGPNCEVAFIPSCPTKERLPRITFCERYVRYVPFQYERFYVDLCGTFPIYLQNFSSKSRSTLVRKVRKYMEHAGVTPCFREYRSPEEIREFFRLARQVSPKTYQERMLSVGLPQGEQFEHKLQELALRGSVRGYILFFGERPIAYLYCPVREDIVFYEHLGYDPAFRQWSPGTVLQYFALESLFSEKRFRMFDFTEGEGFQKKFFSTGSVMCADLYYFRRTGRSIVLVLAHYWETRLSDAVARGLEKVKLKNRLKNFFRHGMSRSGEVTAEEK